MQLIYKITIFSQLYQMIKGLHISKILLCQKVGHSLARILKISSIMICLLFQIQTKGLFLILFLFKKE